MRYKVIRIIGVVLLVLGAALIILDYGRGEVSHSNDRRGWDADWLGRRFAWFVT